METEIVNTVKQIIDLSEAEIDEFLDAGRFKTFKPGVDFIKAGQIPTEFGVVTHGLFRYVYISEEGKEFTKVFMPEGSFISSYSAMVSKTTSFFSVEAIEASEVFIFTYTNWEKLRSKNHKWTLLLVKLLEKGYGTKEKREREFLLLDAESRYRIFLEE